MTRRLAVLALVGVAGALAGSVGVGPATAGPETTPACELLTAKEVKKALGQPVLDGVPTARVLSGTAGESDTCTWSTEDPDTGIIEGIPLAIVATVQSGCAEPDPEGCFENDKILSDLEKPLKKLGDDAFYEYHGKVEVLVDDLILEVKFNSFNEGMLGRKEFERRTVKLAKKAVARLEA